MKRSDILRRLNNINIQIGKLMEDSSGGYEDLAVIQTRGGDFKYWIEKLQKGESIDQELMDNYKTISIWPPKLSSKDAETLQKYEKDPERLKQAKRIVAKLKILENKMDKGEDEISNKYKNDTKAALNDEANKTMSKERNLIYIGVGFIIIGVIVAIFMAPKIAQEFNNLFKSFSFANGMSFVDKCVNALKSILTLTLISLPILIGIACIVAFYNRNNGRKIALDDNTAQNLYKTYKDGLKKLMTETIDEMSKI